MGTISKTALRNITILKKHTALPNSTDNPDVFLYDCPHNIKCINLPTSNPYGLLCSSDYMKSSSWDDMKS